MIFDRSWYNRAGVEHVMGFCTEEEYAEFLRACPEFERMLIRSGVHLVKYWLSVSDEEQEKRFQQRAGDPAKLWKLSPMDIVSRERWVEYSRAKDAMMEYTDVPEARWRVAIGRRRQGVACPNCTVTCSACFQIHASNQSAWARAPSPTTTTSARLARPTSSNPDFCQRAAHTASPAT